MERLVDGFSEMDEQSLLFDVFKAFDQIKSTKKSCQHILSSILIYVP